MQHRDVLIQLLEAWNPWWRGAPAWPTPPVRRELQPTILRRLEDEPRRAALIRGPRQVGKTVMLLQSAADLLEAGLPSRNLLYFRFDDERLPAEVSLREVLELFVPGDANQAVVCLLDEVTSARAWDRGLKLAVDEGGRRIVATDSSARLLRKGSEDSGVGRWDEIELETLTFREALSFQARVGEEPRSVLMRSPGALFRHLRTGGYPEHVGNDMFTQVDDRLRRDISDRVIGRDLATFDVPRVQRLFAYLAQTSGGLVNVSNLASNLQADQRSVREWLEALRQAMLIFPLSALTSTATPRLRARDKLYVADPGIVCAYSPASSPLDDSDTLGRALETLVSHELRKRNRLDGGRVHYYRESEKVEVDFVWETPQGIGLIEAGTRYRSDKERTLQTVAERLKVGHAFQLCPGPSGGGSASLMLEEFLLDTSVPWEVMP